MQKLGALFDTELSKSEFTRRLILGVDDYVISNVRTSLYSEARSKDLCIRVTSQSQGGSVARQLRKTH